MANILTAMASPALQSASAQASQQQAEARAAEKAAAVAAAQQKRIALQAAVKAKADTRVQQMQQQQQQRAAANVARAQARPPKPPPPPARVIPNPFAQGRTPVITNYGQGYVDPQTLMDGSPPAQPKPIYSDGRYMDDIKVDPYVPPPPPPLPQPTPNLFGKVAAPYNPSEENPPTEATNLGSDFANQMQKFKKGGQIKVAQDTKKKYTSGGKINLNECRVSTAEKSKKNSNW